MWVGWAVTSFDSLVGVEYEYEGGSVEGRVLSDLSFLLTNECFVFSRDFESLATISWMKEGESVDILHFSDLLLPIGIATATR
jgi:hypothetical protein